MFRPVARTGAVHLLEDKHFPIHHAGYWVSPAGAFFLVERHIYSVCDFPQFFGLCDEDIRTIYRHMDEAYRTEEKARQAIIAALVRHGWIRARNYVARGADMWTINLPSLEPSHIARACEFMRCIYGDRDSYAPVTLDSPNTTVTSSVHLMLSGVPIESMHNIPPDKVALSYIEDLSDEPSANTPQLDIGALMAEIRSA